MNYDDKEDLEQIDEKTQRIYAYLKALHSDGFHPLKARESRSIPNLQDVHRQGRTAFGCTKLTGTCT
jgi:hypothetical protein